MLGAGVSGRVNVSISPVPGSIGKYSIESRLSGRRGRATPSPPFAFAGIRHGLIFIAQAEVIEVGCVSMQQPVATGDSDECSGKFAIIRVFIGEL